MESRPTPHAHRAGAGETRRVSENPSGLVMPLSSTPIAHNQRQVVRRAGFLPAAARFKRSGGYGKPPYIGITHRVVALIIIYPTNLSCPI